MSELHRSVRINRARINESASLKVIVIRRASSDVAGKRDREFSGRIVGPEKDVRQSISTFLRRVELLYKSSSRVRNPRLSDGLAGGEDYDCLIVDSENLSDQIRLSANEVKAVNIDVLTGTRR